MAMNDLNTVNERREREGKSTYLCVGLAALLVLIATAVGIIVFKWEKLPEHKRQVLGQSLKELQEARKKQGDLQAMVTNSQQIFLKSLNTGGTFTAAEGIEKNEYLNFLEEKFKSGPWTEEEKASMRTLLYATSTETSNRIDCDLEDSQKCMLSKLQVLVRHYKDQDKVDRMNLYYSHSKVDFSLQQFKESTDGGKNGFFWNVAHSVGLIEDAKEVKPKIPLEALGHLFLQYTSNEHEREFYRKIVDTIDPFRKGDEQVPQIAAASAGKSVKTGPKEENKKEL